MSAQDEESQSGWRGKGLTIAYVVGASVAVLFAAVLYGYACVWNADECSACGRPPIAGNLRVENAPGFDAEAALRLGRIVSEVYEPFVADLLRWKSPTCSRHLADFQLEAVVSSLPEGGRALVGYDPTLGGIVAAFRGNSHSINWLMSAAFITTRPEPITPSAEAGEVHAGFLNIYRPLRSALLDVVEKLLQQHPEASLYTVGHSMGGTGAMYLALDLGLLYPDRGARLYSFASPVSGDADFASFFDRHVPSAYRVVHSDDTVTKLPPAWWPCRFVHAGHEVVEEVEDSTEHRYHLGVEMGVRDDNVTQHELLETNFLNLEKEYVDSVRVENTWVFPALPSHTPTAANTASPSQDGDKD